MLLKLLDALEKNVNEHECAVNDILCDYDEEICHKCERDCNECKDDLIEQIKKLKEEASKKNVRFVSQRGQGKLLEHVMNTMKDNVGENRMTLINKWLDIMEKDLEDDHGGCRVDGVLSCLGYKKRFNHGCPPCEQCKKESQDIIAKIRKEWEWYQVELAHKIKLALENKQAISEETSDTQKDNVNHQKHQNMTIRNLVEVGYFKFNVKLDDSYYEFECLPTDFIDFVYGEDFLNQEIIAITQGTDGKMYVTLKEK